MSCSRSFPDPLSQLFNVARRKACNIEKLGEFLCAILKSWESGPGDEAVNNTWFVGSWGGGRVATHLRLIFPVCMRKGYSNRLCLLSRGRSRTSTEGGAKVNNRAQSACEIFPRPL